MLHLHAIWSALSTAAPPEELADSPLTGVAIDSRQVEEGYVFVALRGERTDGHRYVEEALERGAQLVLVEEFVEMREQAVTFYDLRKGAHQVINHAPRQPAIFLVDNTLQALQKAATAWRARFAVQVIGITGSVGKTTTKELVAAVLSQRYATLKNVGNLNNEIGLPLTLLGLNKEHEQVVLEMGMYDVGEIATLCQIARPQVGVVTNVGPSHLERLGSIERIAQAKRELVEALPMEGVALLNADDPLVMGMAPYTKARILTYGLSDSADLQARHIESAGLEGIRFVVQWKETGEQLHVKVPLLGRHSAHTALRAIAVGLVQGLDWHEIIAGLQNVRHQLRLVTVQGIRGSMLLDDTYNASPASSIAALNLLADLSPRGRGRRIAVLGDMTELGAYTQEGHILVGRRAAEVADILVTIGPLAQIIGHEAIASGMARDKVTILEDKATAIDHLRSVIGRGDVVLVKGSRAAQLEDVVTGLSRTEPD